MKKTKIVWVLCIAAMLMTVFFAGCSEVKKEEIVEEPEITQIRNICNLATLDCYYHNVAKSVKKAQSGIKGLGEKDRTFWIEYTGIARLGIDMSEVNMIVRGDQIEIAIPEAKVIKITVDKKSFNEESIIASEDGLNKNKITAEDQVMAIQVAQKEMEETVMENSTLLLSAQNRAKVLIENYIKQLGEAAGINYQIKWVEAGVASSNAEEETLAEVKP